MTLLDKLFLAMAEGREYVVMTRDGFATFHSLSAAQAYTDDPACLLNCKAGYVICRTEYDESATPGLRVLKKMWPT